MRGIIGTKLSKETQVSKIFRPYDPDQPFLMPVSMRE